jgi:hypothetical protein
MRATFLYTILILLSVQSFGQFTAREYFKFGKSKFDDRKYFEAIDFLDKAIALDPAYENIRRLYSRILSQKGCSKDGK